RQVALAEPTLFKAISGHGVSAFIDGHQVVIGNATMPGLDAVTFADRAEALRRDGQTVLFVGVDGQLAGLLGVADPIKASTPDAIRDLHAAGLRIVMLTGD